MNGNEKGGVTIAQRKTTTSSEVKQRWISSNYKRYGISLRYDTDKKLIDYLEAHRNEDSKGTTDIIRDALTKYINEGEEVLK